MPWCPVPKLPHHSAADSSRLATLGRPAQVACTQAPCEPGEAMRTPKGGRGSTVDAKTREQFPQSQTFTIGEKCPLKPRN